MQRSGFRKPENALKRANELEGVGQSNMAWDVLKEQLNSKKHRSAWSSVHEKLMIKFINLSVTLQKQPDDGLKDFKQITATTAVASMGVVVRHFLDTATTRVEEAQALVTESMAVVDAVEDLEETITPEEMLLAAVSDDDNESRTHKALLMPWVKYLWEGYRAVLEVLRNNNKLEDLYQEVAQRAFGFCHKFQRRNEFGRLVDQLRRHFAQIIKYPNQQNAINLSNAVTLQLLLETRFEQLNTAIKMDLWKVAFASIEDIHHLMDEGPKAPKPLMVAEYYKKLGMIFWKSETYLLHATALHKLFMITKEHNKKFSGEAAQQMAAQVLLATLAVPVQHPDLDILKVQVHQTTYAAMENSKARIENTRKMCMYAGINSIPTREELMQSLISMKIMQYVPPNLKELFNVMEQEFQPLQLASKVQPILEFIAGKEHLEQYAESLKELVLLRLIKQLSQVYTTIKVSRLNKLVPFLTPVQIEKVLVDAVTGRTLVFRLNHRDQSLVFSSTLLVASDDTDGGARLSAPQTGVLRGQLTTLSKRLRTAINMIDPARRTRLLEARQRSSEDLVGSIEQEHDQIVKRKRQIEKLKEEQENARIKMAKDMHARAAKQAEEKRKAEDARKEREREAREAREAEEAEKLEKLREKKAIIESIRITEIGRQALAKHAQEDLEKMPIEQIYKIQEEFNRKQEDQLTQRLQAQERKVDYLERAKRKDEIPLLKKELEERKAEWLAKSKSIHANRLEAKSRLQRMVAQQKAFADVVLGERQAQYANQKAEFDKKLAAQAEKQKELRALEEKRKKKEREEDAKREAAVADERRLFEENRLANAKKKKVEDAERDQELERVAEKQKQREAELEERREKEQEEQREKAKLEREAPARDVRGPPTRDVRGPPARDTAPARAPAGAGGGWRDRERQREEQRTAPGPSVRADAPPTRAAEPDRWARDARAPGDDTRGGQGGYRAPARREDGPPARRDDPPRGDAGAGGRGGAYRPAVRRDEDSRGGGGAYRPPARGGGDGGGDRWQRGGALPAREARPTQSAQPTRGVGDAPPPAQGRGEDDGWTQATGRRPGAGRGRPPPAQ
eukprot:m.27848 g.27848  ORF g.27848 m.27848 type:complete len:1081 (+) comp11962_c0_seq1:89-3331(+)